MKNFKRLIIAYFLPTFIFMNFPQKAYAYLDAGTGSYILQLIIAAFVAGLFIVKMLWKKITDFFKNLFSGNKKYE